MTSPAASSARCAARRRGPSRGATTPGASVSQRAGSTMRRVFLGIDCGTQSTKAVLRDAADGAIVAIGRADHEIVERDDGTREQEPRWWVDALIAAARDA